MLRQWNYRDQYHPNMTVAEEAHLSSHAGKFERMNKELQDLSLIRFLDHCFEMLRQVVMCHPDLSLTTFTWNDTTPKPMFDVRGSVHVCADWNNLLGSVKDRVVSEAEVESLINPLWSPSMPET